MTHDSNFDIPHGEILAKATGLDHDVIWNYLLDFVLWGRPSEVDRRKYCLYYCWEALRLLLSDDPEPENWQWANGVYSITAAVLGRPGWDNQRVEQESIAYKNGVRTLNTQLAHQVGRTIVEYREWRLKGGLLRDGRPANYIQPGMWVFHIERDVPVFVNQIATRPTMPDYSGPTTKFYEVLIPRFPAFMQTSVVNDKVRVGYFDIELVQAKQLARIQPDFDELQY